MSGLTTQQLEAVGELMREAGEPVQGPLRAQLLTGGRSNLTYRIGDGVTSWVLRRPPTGGLTPSAHDVAREYRVCSGLHGTDVPVARPVLLDESSRVLDAPFVVTEYVDGVTLRSQQQLADVSDPELDRHVDALLDVLVALHQVDVERADLGSLGRGTGYAGRQVRRWSRQWELIGAEDGRASRLAEQLRQRVPVDGAVSVVHGDFRIDNVILDRSTPGVVRAVVDWEMSTLGEAVADVALMCAYRHPALDAVLGVEAAWTSPRLPEAAELRSRYEDRAGRVLHEWGFFLALAHFKLAVIAEGIAHRHRLGATAGEGYEDAGAAVGAFLEAGLEVGSARG